MDIKNWTRKTSSGLYSITEVAAWIGYVLIAAIVMIVFVDVCGRYFLNKPLLGAYELVEQSMGVLAGFAIMFAVVKSGHVALDLITGRLPRRTQAIMQSIFSLLGFGISVVLAYLVFQLALHDQKPFPQTTSVLHIATTPFTFILAIALFLCSLTFLMQTFHPVASKETMEGRE